MKSLLECKYMVELFNWTGKQDMTSKNCNVARRGGQKRKPTFIIGISAAILLISASAAFGAFFDTAGQSARPLGMGEVFMASSGDASGYWYNPAGLASCEGKELGISYGMLNPNIASDLMKYQINYVNPLGENSGFGIGVSGLGADGASEMVLSGAYGVSISERFSLGANVKVLRWAIEGQDDPYTLQTDDDLSKLAFSLDISATYSLGEVFGLSNMMTGVYVKDAIMPNISESGDDGGKLPIEVGVGILCQKDNVLAECDVAFVNGETVLHSGLEFGVTGSALKLRGGLIYGSDFKDSVERTDFDFGLGYAFSSLLFDYAYNIPLAFEDTGGRHFVSFGISFD